MILQKSSARSSSSLEASLSVSLVRTCRTLFCMSSASQPRECAMNGNGGNTKPSSAPKGNKIGRAAGRGRGEISGGAGSFKKKKKNRSTGRLGKERDTNRVRR